MAIDPIHKGVSLFLSHTNMNQMNSLHHVKELPQISNFLQFESYSSKCFKVRAISDLRDFICMEIRSKNNSKSKLIQKRVLALLRQFWRSVIFRIETTKVTVKWIKQTTNIN